MDAYIANIEEESLANWYFRKVLFTWPHLQLVVMTLHPWEDIWEEIHDKEDQFIRVEKWHAKAIVNWVESELTDDMIIVIPAGAKHNIINLSSEEKLHLYTIYCQKHHPDGTIHETKADAEAAEDNH
jgi:mannose-6-phosphate isomerase-like protein (cupin superfamily)